ncbi:MAG: succinylglutamate desuccinylase/aspartoacylase family protein [Syntrophomonadaceae bacterium]|nr:succinylglutamate desuccinylase/aspartoacylase family protein [Syntrophomonadaceae bacterium]
MKRVSTKIRWFTSLLLLTFILSTVLAVPLPAQASSQEKVVVAKGTVYATNMYIIRSGKPGPVVMIVGGVHGNEPAGYIAAGRMVNTEIKRGTLIVLPKANNRAVERNVRYYKGHGDLNRDFPTSKYGSADGTLARAIWSAVKKYDVDYLMDMHEGYNYSKLKSSSSVGQSLIYYPTGYFWSTVSSIVYKLNNYISTSYKEFSLLRYPTRGSLTRAAGQYLGVKSFIFETCTKQSLSTRLYYQQKAAQTLLSKLYML